MERAREVLALRQVDGRLPAERAVAGREERRRRLHDGNAAEREGGRQSGHVPHGPAAERHDSPVAAQAAADELLDEATEDGPRLRPLAVRDEEGFFA